MITRDGFFLSNPHTNNGLFFLLTVKYCILCLKKSLYAEMQHDMISHSDIGMASLAPCACVPINNHCTALTRQPG